MMHVDLTISDSGSGSDSDFSTKLKQTKTILKQKVTQRQKQKVESLQTNKASNSKTKARRSFRGHGWSKKGSKAARRKAREQTKKAHYYAVADGWRPGIFKVRKNARAQTRNYHGALYKTFTDLEEANDWMMQNREFPPAVRQPFPPAPDTPLPPNDFLPVPSDDDIPLASAAPVPTATASHNQTFEHILRTNPNLLQSMTYINNRLVRLAPSLCTCNCCPYSTGSESRQRIVLLQRLLQIID